MLQPMEAFTRAARAGMSLEAHIWREVGRHLELEESVRRIAPLLAGQLPIDLLLIRRLDRDPLRLTTLATGACRMSSSLRPTAARSICESGDGISALERWLHTSSLTCFLAGDASPLARVLVPPGLAGAVLAGPLVAGGRPVGVVLFAAAPGARFEPEHLEQAQVVLEPLSVAFESDERLHELARMRSAVEADRDALLSRLARQDISDVVIGESGGLRGVMERVEQVAPTDAPVLILGETGSGKEVIARTIHARSHRAGGPVVRVNCGAIPPELLDSELFGHERGSFTGAVSTRKGWFERADGGTLFLDEIGELPLAAQVRLLRVLQDGTLERIGGQQQITVDVRVVTATHRNLEAMVAEGKFREDLWYRINVFPIRLPPLRERLEDLPTLAVHFARHAGLRLGGGFLVPSERDLALLHGYAWPGNVRELAAVIERAAILGNGKRLELEQALGGTALATPPARQVARPGAAATVDAGGHAGAGGPGSAAGPAGHGADSRPIGTLDQAMVEHIERALAATQGRIEGPFGAARVLGVNPHTLRARMRKLGLDWSRFRRDGGAPPGA
jgi:transcriptional regulator with GAF, ATPase, and Fis domain